MSKRMLSIAAALALLTSAAAVPQNTAAPRGITANAAAFTTGSRLLVDINTNDGRSPSYTSNAENWIAASGDNIETTIGGLTFKLSNGGSVGSGIKTSNCKLLQFDDGTTPTLTMDGCYVEGGENGGTIKLEIMGLSAGHHSLRTWHSCMDDRQISSMSVSVNGKVTNTGVKAVTRVKNDNDAGMSYSEFDVSSGETVTVLIKPEGNGNVNCAYLNAFEIDGADPFKGISRQYPKDQDKHMSAEKGLSWTAGSGALSHDIYIGTDYNSVFNADRSSKEYKGNQTGTTYALDNSYSSLETYYWRVDTVNADGTVKGAVCSFMVNRLAFPTAEGYGRYARGGRGGAVYHVTTLEDTGSEGSLRYALETMKGPRIVVFDVGGVMEIKSRIIIPSDGGDVYVAGQTAPGQGITMIKYGIGAMGAEDIVIRDIHVRVGDANGKGTDGMGLGSCNNCIIDHCSISWGTDEGFSSRGARNITFQHNIIAESLNESVHYDANDRTKTEPHAFAASIGGEVGSFHHNLLVHCTDRNWSLAGGLAQDGKSYRGSLDLTNNVIYNWLGRTTDGGIGRVKFVGNYYKMGPMSRDMALLVISDSAVETPQKAYVSANKMTDINGNTKLEPSQDAWAQSRAISTSQSVSDTRTNDPMWESYINVDTADQAYANVLSNVGANAQGLDQWDTRYIKEVRNGTYTYTGSKAGHKGIIDSQNDVGGYPNTSTFKHSTDGICNSTNDTDRDGIPNVWEEKYGLDPNNASDGAMVSLSTEGYTNIEMFLNELAGDEIQVTQLKRDPLTGTLIEALDIKDAANYNSWSVKQGLSASADFFGDRDVTYKTIPSYLEGAEYVVTAADSKFYNGDLAELTAAKDIDVYVALDERVTEAGSWLKSWDMTDERIINSKDVTFRLYKQTVSAGETITLGTNNQSSGCENYTVIVTEHQEQKVRGDVNADGRCNVADLVLLQKWLLAVPDTNLPDWQAGDLCEDGRIDVFDMIAMRQLLVQNG